MNDILKQRLVGALILVALGVVFWPIIFVQPGQNTGAGPPSIPQPPGVSTEPVDAPEIGDLRGSPERDFQTDADQSGSATLEESVTVEEATVAEISGATEESTQTTATVAEVTRSAPPAPLTLDANGVPKAWTLQVATVSSAEKAEKLRLRLLAMNHKAYIATVSTGGQRLYRVCIGPQVERADLEKLQPGINAEFRVHSMLVRYLP